MTDRIELPAFNIQVDEDMTCGCPVDLMAVFREELFRDVLATPPVREAD